MVKKNICGAHAVAITVGVATVVVTLMGCGSPSVLVSFHYIELGTHVTAD